MTESKYELDLDEDPYTETILPSAQIDRFFSFQDKNQKKKLSCQTVIVDFFSLLHSRSQASKSGLVKQSENNENKKKRIISSISNRDLFNAVVGLYDASLPDMTLDVIYENVYAKQAKTIIVLRDLKETRCEIETERNQSASVQQCDSEDCKFIQDLSRSHESVESSTDNPDSQQGKTSPPVAEQKISDQNSGEGKQTCDELVKSLLGSENDFFTNIFNQCDEETKEDAVDQEEEDEESEEFSAGIHTFKKDIILRKHLQKHHRHIQQQHIGVEDRIIACATYTKVTVESRDRIIQLILMGVKKNCRKMGIGKYVVSKLTLPSVVGSYDAVVVHADYSATDFFQHLGFSDDYLLNSRWSSLCAQFTDCVLMTYIPAFTMPGIPVSLKPDKEFSEMEEEFTLWKIKSLSAYHAQLTCVHRMRNEIFQLKSMVDLQHQLILKLVGENEQLLPKKDNIMSFKQKYADAPTQTSEKSETSAEKTAILSRHECPDGNILTTFGKNTFITFRPPKEKKTSPPDFVHVVNSLTDVIRKFKNDLETDAKHADLNITCAITAISKASVDDKRYQSYQTVEAQSQYSSLVKDRMYFCSHQPITTEKLQEILERGFTNEDFGTGSLGKGLHFCRSPFTAAHFSVAGKLLLAEVQLGRIKCDNQMPCEKEKHQWGSVLTTAPLKISLSSSRSNRNFLEEYVILKAEQATPLCLMEYETSRSIIDYKSNN